MIQRRHVLFPLILVLLTVLLAVAIGLFVSPRAVSAPIEEGTPVSEAGYREDVRDVLRPLFATPEALTETARVSAAYDALLLLSVPSDYRDVHIGLVTSLFLLRDGLAGDEAARLAGLERFSGLIEDNEWLR